MAHTAAHCMSIRDKPSSTPSKIYERQITTHHALLFLFFFRLFFFLSPSPSPPSRISTFPATTSPGVLVISPVGFQSAGICIPFGSPKVSFLHCLSSFFLAYRFLSFFFFSSSLKVAYFLSPAYALRSASSAARISSVPRPYVSGVVSR